ncbi:MAG: 2-oxoacid:acceptor oxidoreductase family protein [archaeon]
MTVKKPQALREEYTKDGDKHLMHYCPGCGHGNVHNYIAKAIDELGINDKVTFISPVGCSVFGYWYFNTGNIQAAHGRAPAVATGIKRSDTESIVICYQGDGDLAAIGTAEIIHAANRGENITVIFINNAIYGMTGGQLAPTTLPMQKSNTSPEGRDVSHEGYPIGVCELLSSLKAPAYIARTSLSGPKEEAKTMAAIKKAIKCQMDGDGFSLVEVLSPCPTQWKKSLSESRKYLIEEMEKYFPLGTFRDKIGEKKIINHIEGNDKINLALSLPDYTKIRKDNCKKEDFPKRIIASGFGGQGVMFMADLICLAAHSQGKIVGSLPSYGPEQRSGTANKSVVISDKEIGSLNISTPDIVIALSPEAIVKYLPRIKKGGILIYNSSIFKENIARDDIVKYPVPASEIAQKAGSALSSNMVMLGAFIKATELISLDSVEAIINAKEDKKGMNVKNILAIKEGIHSVEN